MDSKQLTPLLRIILPTALFFCSTAIIPPNADFLVRERFGLTNDEASSFFTINSLPQVLFAGIFLGLLSDRIQRRIPLAILGCLGTGLTTLALPFIQDYTLMLGVRFVDGLFGILAAGMLMTRVIDLSTRENRALVMAVFMSAIPIGYLLGSILTAALGGIDPALPFLIAGIGLIAAAIPLFLDMRAREPVSAEQSTLPEIVRAMANTPKLLFPYFFGFIDKFTFAFIAMLTSLALADEFGLQAIVWGGSALAIFWVGYLAAVGFSGMLTARFGPWLTVAAGSAGYGLALIALFAVMHPAWFLAVLLIAGVFVALQTNPCLVLVGDLAGPNERATAMAGFNLTGSYGMLIGFAAAGILSAGAGYAAAFSVAGALEIASAMIAVAAVRKLSFKLTNQTETGSVAPAAKGVHDV